MGFYRMFSIEGIWKIYARVIWGDWGEVRTYTTHGISHRVIWIRTSKWMAGQNMFGGIFLNAKRLEELSENVSNYVFLHEYGHSQPPFILQLLSVVAQVLLIPLALVGTIVFPIMWFVGAIQLGISSSLIPYTLSQIMAFAMLLLPLMLVRWLDEGHAEVFAASKTGVAAYQAAKREMRENLNPNLLRLVVYYAMYPPIRLVSKFASK